MTRVGQYLKIVIKEVINVKYNTFVNVTTENNCKLTLNDKRQFIRSESRDSSDNLEIRLRHDTEKHQRWCKSCQSTHISMNYPQGNPYLPIGRTLGKFS